MEELTTTPCAGRQNLEYLQHEDFSLKTGCWKETDCFLALSALKTRLYGKTNEWMNKLIDAHPGLEVPWVLQREDFSLRTGWLKEVFLAPYLRPQRELFLLWHEAG
ncbi:uncharacterized protein LOC144924752 isoform X2 [Branchiostoma floridae x Branchiostoma belcheri]